MVVHMRFWVLSACAKSTPQPRSCGEPNAIEGRRPYRAEPGELTLR